MPREHIPSEYATKLVMNVDGLTKVHLPEYISEYEPKNNAEAKVLLRKGEF